MSRLGVPARLVHLLLFTLRHIYALHGEYARLRQAMRARAFTPRSDGHAWNTLGWLIGMLPVRSLERSRRTLAAMRCRGFHGRLYLLDDLAWGSAVTLLGAATALALMILVALAQEHAAGLPAHRHGHAETDDGFAGGMGPTPPDEQRVGQSRGGGGRGP